MRKGSHHSPETRAAISAARTGKLIGYKHSPEAHVKMSAAQVGNHKTLGYKHSLETRANMSAARKGHPLAADHRIKLTAVIRATGTKASHWKGGTYLNHGYRLVYAPGHPYASDNYVREHRLIMERILGRYLLPQEVVHHDDENKLNNAAYNLVLFGSNTAHMRYHRLKRQAAA